MAGRNSRHSHNFLNIQFSIKSTIYSKLKQTAYIMKVMKLISYKSKIQRNKLNVSNYSKVSNGAM